MIYNNLAKYYDALLKDDEAVSMWIDFFDRHHMGKTVLELASGTGEITLQLAKKYDVDASDLSDQMLDQIRSKDIENSILNMYTLDMSNFNLDKRYDNIVCFCDSINYLSTLEAVESFIQAAYKHLNNQGILMFDMHTEDRLEEFEDPFIETGQLLGTDYQWSILSQEDQIYHHFAFYEDEMIQEYHTQTVFKTSDILDLLEKYNFKTKVYTDFNQEGIHKGEKIFIVGEKL